MKVIVNIPKEVLEHPHNYCCYSLANQIKENYTPIPDNATNGDMIIAMFPNVEIDIVNNTVLTDIDNGCWFSLDWWNAPYRKE